MYCLWYVCSLFKVQARYIVERMDSDLWNKVLLEDNQFRRQLIDQVCRDVALTFQASQHCSCLHHCLVLLLWRLPVFRISMHLCCCLILHIYIEGRHDGQRQGVALLPIFIVDHA